MEIDRLGHERDLMVDRQIARRGIGDADVLDAMRRVPRHLFVPHELRDQAYADCALPIGHGQTISQPFMVAAMCEALGVDPAHRVLEIGGGSGYQAAVLSHLAREVTTVELVPDLARMARRNLDAAGYAHVVVLAADGSQGPPGGGHFDRIIVAAGAPAVPEPLVRALLPGGRLVVPVGSRQEQKITVVEMGEGGARTSRRDPCVFVPLVGKYGWPG